MTRKIVEHTRTITEKVATEVRCSSCGKLAPNPAANGYADVNWSEPGLPVRCFVTIQMKVVHEVEGCFDTDLDVDDHDWDICPDCFNTKIRPLLGPENRPEEE